MPLIYNRRFNTSMVNLPDSLELASSSRAVSGCSHTSIPDGDETQA
jgi:hypothetical protein